MHFVLHCMPIGMSLYTSINLFLNLFFLPPACPPPPPLLSLSSLSHHCLLVYFILRFSFRLSGTSGNVDYDTSSVIVNIVVFTVL